MPEEPIRYCYSTDEERYHGDFATREEAEAEAWAECSDDQATVWTAEAHKPDTSTLLPDGCDLVDRIIDHMAEAASEVWEEAEWPDVDDADTKDLARRLDETIAAWGAEKVSAPTFWTCDKVREHVRTVPTPEEPR